MVDLRGKRVCQISCGSLHTIAQIEDNKGLPSDLYVWGDTIGDHKYVPRVIKSLEGKKVISIASTALVIRFLLLFKTHIIEGKCNCYRWSLCLLLDNWKRKLFKTNCHFWFKNL